MHLIETMVTPHCSSPRIARRRARATPTQASCDTAINAKSSPSMGSPIKTIQAATTVTMDRHLATLSLIPRPVGASDEESPPRIVPYPVAVVPGTPPIALPLEPVYSERCKCCLASRARCAERLACCPELCDYCPYSHARWTERYEYYSTSTPSVPSVATGF